MTTSPASAAGLTPDRCAGLLDALVRERPGAGSVAGAAGARAASSGAPRLAALGPLVVPVSGMPGLLDALDSDRWSEPLQVVLDADTGLVEAAEARSVLLDDDRVALRGLRLALPPDVAPGTAARRALEALDFALPSWIALPAVDGWEEALDVLADDGAEQALLDLPSAPAGHAASFVVACVHRGLPFAVSGPTSGEAVAGLLAATAAALEAREVPHVAALMPAAPEATLAVLADTDPGAVRRRLTHVDVVDPAPVLAGLDRLGLLPQEEGR